MFDTVVRSSEGGEERDAVDIVLMKNMNSALLLRCHVEGTEDQ